MTKIISLTHPIFIALFFILALFAYNREQVLYRDLLTPLGIATLFVVAISCAFFFLFKKNAQKAALAATIFMIFFSAYGHAFDPGGMGNYWIRQRYFLPLWTLSFAAIASILFYVRRDLSKLSFGITLIIFGMNAVSAASIIRYELSEKHALVAPIDPARVDWSKAAAKPDMLPDIYYIMPDAYSSTRALKEFYDYDNSAFENFLKEKGFYIVPKSRSNYTGTAFSMATILNLEYVEKLSAGGILSRATFNPRKLIAENRVGKFFQSLGYTYIHLGSWWEGDFRVPAADKNINKGLMSEFMLNVFKKTVIYPFAYQYGALDDRRINWERMRYQFDEVAKTFSRREPTFTFFHIGAPHGPFVFHADGSFIEWVEPELRGVFDDESIGQEKLLKKYYPDQLTYVTKQLEALVSRILETSATPPIIVIQSDHGSSLFPRSHKDYRRNRLKNFSAFYLPYGGNDMLWEDITPVNTFRVLFNYYFGTDFEKLPDRSFARPSLTDELHPTWDLADVTEEVAADYYR